MKKIFFVLTLTTSLNVFSLENCIYFPVNGEIEQPFKSKITKTSEAVFENCPDSVLLSERFVARLSQVLNYKGERSCLYTRSAGSILFLCRQ